MGSTSIFSPPADIHGRPKWLTVTPEQAAKANIILMRDFWKSDTPFAQPAYRKIGFPFVVGHLTWESVEDIYRSSPYQNAVNPKAQIGGYSKKRYIRFYGKKTLDRKKRFVDAVTGKKTPAFLMNAFRQIMFCDYFLYGQNNLSWKFSVYISRVDEKAAQQKVSSNNHMDFLPEAASDRAKFVRDWVRAFREGQRAVAAWENVPSRIRGTHRIYTVGQPFQTKFKNHAPFQALDIVHFIAEEHRSPQVPEPCTRFFIRGAAVPV